MFNAWGVWRGQLVISVGQEKRAKGGSAHAGRRSNDVRGDMMCSPRSSQTAWSTRVG